MPRLEVLDGKSKGEVFDLPERGEVKIGNRRGVQVPIRDAGISFTHAAIIAKNGKFEVTDLGSKKGTSVNGKALMPKATETLEPGAEIDLGGVVKLRFLTDDMGAEEGGGAADAALKEKVQELQKKLKIWKARAKEAEEKLGAGGGDDGEEASAPAATDERVKELEREAKRYKRKLEQLEQELAEKEDAPAGPDLSADLQKAEREAARHKGRVDDLERELEHAKQRARIAEDDVKSERKRASRAEDQVSSLEKQLAEASGSSKGGGADPAELEALRTELREVKKQKSAYEDSKESEIMELENRLTDLQDEKRRLLERIEDMEQEGRGGGGGGDTTALEAELEALKGQLDELADEHAITEEELEKEVETLSKQVEELTAREAAQKDRIQELEREVAAGGAPSGGGGGGDGAVRVKELEQEAEELRAQLDELAQEQADAEAELEKEIETLSAKVEELEGTIEELEQALEEAGVSMEEYAVFVRVTPAEAAPFTFVPSPVMGGNLGAVVGVMNGASLWMCGRGQDGVVGHEMEGETTYAVEAELPSGVKALVGPISTTLEVKGRVQTRDVGPLKVLVNMVESSFWAFGEEGEVRAVARGAIVADGATEPAMDRAAVGDDLVPFGLPRTGDGAELPPVLVPARACRDLHAMRYAVIEGTRPLQDCPPYVVRGQAALEVLENGYPTGAHASGFVEVRHATDIRIAISDEGRPAVFLRWRSQGGFDEASRRHLTDSARRADDEYKERVARDTDARAEQERDYQRRLEQLESMASGLGAEERMDAEIEAFMADATLRVLSEDEIEEGGQAIRKAYETKREEGRRHRMLLGELARRVADLFGDLIPAQLHEQLEEGWGEQGEERKKKRALNLASPTSCYESMLAALEDGDFERFKAAHTESAAESLTREGFERAVRMIAQQGPPKVKEIVGDEHSQKVVLESGKYLTRLKCVGDKWLNSYLWTK